MQGVNTKTIPDPATLVPKEITYKGVLRKHLKTGKLCLLFPEVAVSKVVGICRGFSGKKWVEADWYAWMRMGKTRPGTEDEWDKMLAELPQPTSVLQCNYIKRHIHATRELTR